MDAREQAAAARAQWLAALAEALEEARQLAVHLGYGQPYCEEAVLLRMQILAVQAQVEALRQSRAARLGAEWPSPWHGAAARPDQLP